MDSDPYEQKLFQMFSSHDVASTGSLDEEALLKLGQTLELRDRVPMLIAACLANANAERRVTFKGFKEGLLTLLGGSDPDESGGECFQNANELHNMNNCPRRVDSLVLSILIYIILY